jgi:hypothetical protein
MKKEVRGDLKERRCLFWFEDDTFQERGKFKCLETNEFIVCI